MKILVLGSGACGGRPARQGSLALSVDGIAWLLINASPDIAHQLRAHPELQAGAAIQALLLLDAQLQSVLGLLSLREHRPLEVYATPLVFEDLTEGLPLLPMLEPYCSVHWHPLPVAGCERSAGFRIPGFEGLRFEAQAVPGLRPSHARRREPRVGDHIALRVEDRRSGQCLVFAPALAGTAFDAAGPGPEPMAELDAEACGLFWAQAADCWLLDARAGPRQAAGRHILLGPQEPGAPAHAELAYDGMVIEL